MKLMLYLARPASDSYAQKTGKLLRKDWHSSTIRALINLRGANAPGDPCPAGPCA